MPEFVYAIDTKDVPLGRAVPVMIGDRWYAVCNDSGTFHVTAFNCPHENGPLGKGHVHDGKLYCPVHHWPWDLRTGLTDPKLPQLRLRIYACEVRDGQVFADVSQPMPPGEREISRP